MRMTIRWLNRADLAECLEIEQLSFSSSLAWEIENFEQIFEGHHYGLVAIVHERIVGYVLTKRARGRAVLISVAVHPAIRRRGVATELFEELTKRHQASKLVCWVPDTMPIAHYFLRAMGWKAKQVCHDWYGPDQDAYEFEWSRKSVLVPGPK